MLGKQTLSLKSAWCFFLQTLLNVHYLFMETTAIELTLKSGNNCCVKFSFRIVDKGLILSLTFSRRYLGINNVVGVL